MKILLDNGHGSDTPGKRSPDGFFREYSYSRFIACEVHQRLRSLDIDSELLVPELEDIPLPERCRRVNEACQRCGIDHVILISIHVNASGKGDHWMKARGWSCFTSWGRTSADDLASCLYDAASTYLPGHKLRKDYTDGDPDLEENFYILKHTLCPAVLTENLFMDNREDLEYLESEEGAKSIIGLHVRGLLDYLK